MLAREASVRGVYTRDVFKAMSFIYLFFLIKEKQKLVFKNKYLQMKCNYYSRRFTSYVHYIAFVL